jgi:Vault protein inter-alpha-trypsin domain
MAFAHNTLVDPLAAFIDGAVDADRLPVPLISTRFDVTLAGGLAVVSAIRVFRNAEARSIEATITLPVPVHAQVFGLTARIGERTVTAIARAKAVARETYEDAVDRGKTAVLHEEALRGVHVLSVAHVAPDEELEVRVDWVESLRAAGKRLKLRIPNTVGEIYGRSPLPEHDDLLTGGEVRIAEISIAAEGPVWLGQTPVEGGRAAAPLNRPIDLSIPAAALPRTLMGFTAGGGRVRLSFSAAGGDQPLDLAILVDRSGSMDTRCAADGPGTKHQAVVHGLASASLGATDRVHLWQFDDHAEPVGESDGAGLPGLAARLGAPRGGTEIGEAIGTVIAASKAADILVITDGQSHAFDVQALGRRGRRISVVLVGEDSLEARIGHLAATTNGEILIAADSDIPAVIATAFAALRGGAAAEVTDGALVTRRGGLILEARWEREAVGEEAPELARAVGALAASLKLPTLSEAEAAKLAEREGLVTHLTSLVLVDEAGATQEDIPVLRKVALPKPAVTQVFAPCALPDTSPAPAPRVLRARSLAPEASSFLRRRANEQPPVGSTAPASTEPTRRGPPLGEPPPRHSFWGRLFRPSQHRRAELPDWLRGIEWSALGGELAAGELKSLPPAPANALAKLSKMPWVVEKAAALGVAPLLFAILAAALVAEMHGDRGARRVARRLLRGQQRGDLPSANELLDRLCHIVDRRTR